MASRVRLSTLDALGREHVIPGQVHEELAGGYQAAVQRLEAEIDDLHDEKPDIARMQRIDTHRMALYAEKVASVGAFHRGIISDHTLSQLVVGMDESLERLLGDEEDARECAEDEAAER